MIVLRMVMAQEYSLSLHLSLASPTLAHRGDETCVVLVAAVVGSRITITYYKVVVIYYTFFSLSGGRALQ